MIWTIPSSTPSELSLKDALELANDQLEAARKASNPSKALALCNDAESKIKEAQKIFVAKKTVDASMDDGIANAYYEHAKLLEGLGYSDRAQKSRSKAEKWGYVDVFNQQTGSSQSSSMSGSIRRSLCPPVALSAAPMIAIAISGSTGAPAAAH